MCSFFVRRFAHRVCFIKITNRIQSEMDLNLYMRLGCIYLLMMSCFFRLQILNCSEWDRESLKKKELFEYHIFFLLHFRLLNTHLSIYGQRPHFALDNFFFFFGSFSEDSRLCLRDRLYKCLFRFLILAFVCIELERTTSIKRMHATGRVSIKIVKFFERSTSLCIIEWCYICI